MEPIILDDLIEIILHSVEQHKLGTGAYCRWLWDNGKGRNLGLNEYGCADAANILYTVGRFPGDPEERAVWISTLQSLQNPETGLFHEKTHHYLHSTAHCSAALELFDAKPLYPVKALEPYATVEGMQKLLESINWQDPWDGSHIGAGILPSLDNTGAIDLKWKNAYFSWLWEHTDPETGFFYYAADGAPRQARLFEYMAGGFHYFFNHEAEHRPMRYPEKVIDSCLWLMDPARTPQECGALAQFIGFIDVDAVFSLTRAMRQTDHRFREAKAMLENFAERYVAMFASRDFAHDEYFNDLHSLFGAVCCLAELQSALPGKILTTKPLKLVLDRRPFI